MKGQLHEDYVSIEYEQSLTNMAYDLFDEMYGRCRKAARYGLKSIKIRLSDLPTYAWIDKRTEEQVLARLMRFIQEEKLLKSYGGGIYELTWEKPHERVPIVRTSDLIEAGYPINEAR